MLKAVNINKFIKILTIVLSILFMATACSYNEGDSTETGDRTAVSSSAEITTDNDARACWQTGIIDLLYDNMGTLAFGMYSKITNGAMAAMMIFFALWLCFRLIKHVGSFTEENIAEVWMEIFQKLFICVICGMIASSSTHLMYIMNNIIFPLFNAFLEFGSEILSKSGQLNEKTTTITVMGADLSFSGEKLICKASAITEVGDGFPESPREMINCLICALNDRMNLGYTLAFKVLQAPGLMKFLVSFFLIACFTIVKFSFVLYLVDSIFKFTVTVIMLPIFVMGYAFKKTQSWLSKGFIDILVSAAFMMFIAITMTMALLAIEQVLKDNADIFADGSEASLGELGVPFMSLVLIGFLIASSVEIASVITSSLVGGGGDDFQKKIKAVLQFAKAHTWDKMVAKK